MSKKSKNEHRTEGAGRAPVVRIEISYTEDGTPMVDPETVAVEPGFEVIWASPPGETRPFTVVFGPHHPLRLGKAGEELVLRSGPEQMIRARIGQQDERLKSDYTVFSGADESTRSVPVRASLMFGFIVSIPLVEPTDDPV